MLSITIDQKSIEAVAAKQLDLDTVVTGLGLPASNKHATCSRIADHGYILSPSFQIADGLLIISLAPDGPLSALAEDVREEAVSRLLRCALLIFTGRTRSIPISWRPYHLNNRLAFQADRRARPGGLTDAGRVVMEITQRAGPCVFAFALDRSGSQHLGDIQSPPGLLNSVYSHIGEAAAKTLAPAPTTQAPEHLANEIMLDPSEAIASWQHFTFDDWYSSRLTVAQRKFVDHPLSTSVRLVGPAGSGKTVAMVVKCLRELRNAANVDHARRFLFLTHASSTASAVEDLSLEMDSTTALDGLTSDPPQLVISTVYAIADAHMRYDLNGLSPVSLDGHEGRTYQAGVLSDVIDGESKANWIAFRSNCSPPFVAYMESSNTSTERRFFLWELLNEFACVLDPEGVRSGTERREKYLTEKRKSWMMPLYSREEREVVLRLYDGFRKSLRDDKAIGTDQMVADFLNYVDSYRWEATRKKEGFDVVFVDELHLFNRQERMLFRHLLRDPDRPPTVFMAYDAKQSPRDTFLGIDSKDAQKYDLWHDARLGKTEKIELVDVFRYTPQIAQALSSIDKGFPGEDLDSDWPAYSGIAKTGDGPVPIVCELQSRLATYGVVFKRASSMQSRLGMKKRVAILCCSYDAFKWYLDSPELRSDFYAITSRDESLAIPHSAKKFVFSMPEYVAGLQYDTLLLIDVNRGEVPDGPYSAAALRKFVSQVYLGASRAERRLELFCCTEHGGMAPLLSLAVAEGTINRVEREDLKT
jgi:hypothetical protein